MSLGLGYGKIACNCYPRLLVIHLIVAKIPIEGIDRESLLSRNGKNGSIPLAAGVVCKVYLDASCCKCYVESHGWAELDCIQYAKLVH